MSIPTSQHSYLWTQSTELSLLAAHVARRRRTALRRSYALEPAHDALLGDVVMRLLVRPCGMA